MTNLPIIYQVLLVFTSQFFLIFSRVLNVRLIMTNAKWKSVFTGFIIQVSWLISSALGVVAVIDSNYWVIVAYFVGGAVGTYLSLCLKIEK